jgi:hypothetical protein
VCQVPLGAGEFLVPRELGLGLRLGRCHDHPGDADEPDVVGPPAGRDGRLPDTGDRLFQAPDVGSAGVSSPTEAASGAQEVDVPTGDESQLAHRDTPHHIVYLSYRFSRL